MTAGSLEHRGIYDDFPGYRLPPDAELDQALRSALVVIDTNLLLNLYRYNESTRDEQADVIRAAALLGGSISRQEVYELCGYQDDRMLRGFTLPTARITRDLQRVDIVADGVDPVLTTVYHGGVKAAAFRIPAEMTAILAEDQLSESTE